MPLWFNTTDLGVRNQLDVSFKDSSADMNLKEFYSIMKFMLSSNSYLTSDQLILFSFSQHSFKKAEVTI